MPTWHGSEVLVSFSELLAPSERAAVGAFTCYDLEAAAAVLSAGAGRGQGVILLIGGRVFTDRHGPLLLAALLAVAERSDARACVQLDHCDDLAVIEAALDAGAGAVMADGSARPYAANIEFVRRAADLAHARGAEVECELGGIAGDEDVAEAVAAGALTDPGQAAEFMAETGGDGLAVSIGNVHGIYRQPPDLDWARLEAIRTSTRHPLSLHGASGIPEGELRRAIRSGIAKVNFNTELRQAYLASTRETLPDVFAGARVAALHAAQTDAVGRVVDDKLAVLRGEAPT